MKKINILGLMALGIVSANPTIVRAEENTSIDFLNGDYVEQKEALETKINENNTKITNIKTNLSTIENDLNENYNSYIELSGSKNNTKMGLSKTSTLNSNSDIKIIDTLLGSESISDFFKTLDTINKVQKESNKKLDNIEKQEEVLAVEQENLIASYKTDEIELNKINAENDNLNKLLKEVESQIVRKGEITFNPNNLLEKSNLGLEDIQKILSGTGLYEVAPAFLEAENLYGINSLFLIGLAAEESAWGTSRRAVENNNLTGFGVHSDSSTGINDNSKRANILRTASWLKKAYLTPGGTYYNGTSTQSVNIKYSANPTWHTNINKIATGLLIQHTPT